VDETPPLPPIESADVVRLELDGREIVLVGTAHVSRESVDLVREVIRSERPDHVCVELDEQRHKALAEKARWEKLDLREIIRRKQLATLLMNLLLGSYQKKMGDKLGVMPGTELLEATRVCEEEGIPFSLSDREVRTTLLRAWRSMTLWQRAKMMSGLLAGIFSGEEISEEQLRELRNKDVLSEVLAELAAVLPSLKSVLIDERDEFLAEKIRQSEGQKVVAVVGAGHVEGMRQVLTEKRAVDMEAISFIPPAKNTMKWIGWGIPVFIVGSIAYLGWSRGADVAGENLMFWILINGIPSAIGAALAWAHPLTIVAAFIAAPLTSLSPLIGAGYVVAFVQAYLQPPRVSDIQNVTTAAGKFSGWWKNRLLRVLLAFVLSTLGSAIGTWLGGAKIVRSLIG